MITNKELSKYLQQLLQISTFADYCPNGMQVQGKSQINTIVSGVSANLAFIEKAIEQGADAILVHHGFFWKNEHPEIINNKYNRIKKLIINDINLFAYHLPLDAHSQFGNNIELAKILQIKNPQNLDNSLVWFGELNLKTSDFKQIIANNLGREATIFGDIDYINNIAWCTGGAQNYINDIITLKEDLKIDAYLSGEVSESTPALATENNIIYIAAGHHATERYGVQALGKHLADKFNLTHKFIDIDNIV